jgi:hypothetical protein
MVYPSGGFIPVISGVCTGLVWWSMLNGYLIGLELHNGYTKINKGIFGVIKGILKGMAADAISPWYALIFKTKGYDEISKDGPLNILDEHETDPATSNDISEFDDPVMIRQVHTCLAILC